MISTKAYALVVLVAACLSLKCDALGGCERLIKYNTHETTNSIDINVGGNITLDCISKSDNSEVAWYFDTQPTRLTAPLASQLNSTLSRLTLTNAVAEQSGYYKCSNETTGICFTRIRIGTNPLPVTDFSCTAYNLEYMICNWTSPKNNVDVKYKLDLIYFKSPLEVPSHCTPIRKLKANSFIYNFTSSSNVQYEKFRKTYKFQLTGANELGTSSWDFIIDHYKNLIPGSVERVEVIKFLNNSRMINISYDKSSPMKYFDDPLLYRVQVKSQWGVDDEQTVKNETMVVFTGLQPYSNYTAVIYCLATTADKDDPNMWSVPTVMRFTTLPDIPDASPEIVPGSFRIQSFIDHIDISIYWKGIPDNLKNGKHIRYVITATSGLGMETNLTTDQGLVTFKNLSRTDDYSFSIYSLNEIGLSNHNSNITVGTKNFLMPQPRSITVIAYSPFIYNIKWIPPDNTSQVTGYRIFWIESDSRFQTNPQGDLSWIDVKNNVTKANITIPGRRQHHHFGVTSLGVGTASGIIWNTCIVLFNGTIGRMKFVDAFTDGPTSVTVKWNIDCAEKLGILTGFHIHYCAVESLDDTICKGIIYNDFVNDDNAISHIIGNLKPFTWYKITVSAATEAGEGEQSQAMFVRTFESAPETAVSDMVILEATNSTFLLKWHPPNVTNGVITEYIIYYNTSSEELTDVYRPPSPFSSPGTTFEYNVTKKVLPYTNYSVAITACTVGGCSSPSPVKIVQTDIGVPDQMDPPQARLLNLSYAVVEPEMSKSFNGPSSTWEIKAVIIDENENITYFSTNLSSHLEYLAVDCDYNRKGAKIELQTRASNVKNSEVLFGKWSDYTKLNCVDPTLPPGYWALIGFGILISIAAMGIVGRIVYNRAVICNNKINKTKACIDEQINQCKDEFTKLQRQKNRLNGISSIDHDNGSNRKLLDDDGRTRNISGDTTDTTRSSGSTEELLMQDKGKRQCCNDSIGSGNLDSLSSRPSTTQTSESSLESTSVPESPDSVFNEHPLKTANGISTSTPGIVSGVNNMVNSGSNNGFNPTLTPIGESQDANASQTNTPQHYSKFASYYGAANDTSSPKRGRPMQNGYVAAPYSKFGMGMIGGGSAGLAGGGLNAESPTRDSFYLEIADNDPQILSYSKVGLSIPIFSDRQQSNPLQKNVSTASSPITSTPTHTGYSVLGLGQNNPTIDGMGSTGTPFSQLPPVAVSSPIEGTSKGYVLATSVNNFAIPPHSEIPVIMAQQDCEQNESNQLDQGETPDYTTMNAHKRSPSNASSLTAGYCRLALSRPNSICSETDQNYVRPETERGETVLGSPCGNGPIDIASSVGSPLTNGYSNIACSPVNSGIVIAPTSAVGSSGPCGYATVQQLLQKGNS